MTGCEACDDDAVSALPNYQHVHHVDELPADRHTDEHVIVRGYAVELAGSIATC